tara:strand:+ start:483 stop:686 length:204 start_codon:yes stop_codon:yes gene_type:complete
MGEYRASHTKTSVFTLIRLTYYTFLEKKVFCKKIFFQNGVDSVDSVTFPLKMGVSRVTPGLHHPIMV